VTSAAEQEFVMFVIGTRTHEDHSQFRVLIADRQAENVAIEGLLLFQVKDVNADVPESRNRRCRHGKASFESYNLEGFSFTSGPVEVSAAKLGQGARAATTRLRNTPMRSVSISTTSLATSRLLPA